jgi:short-subunit dehydrogenase
MPTALITGASKGIGKAIAEHLAKINTDLLLVARSEDLLKELAESLHQTYGVKTDYLAIDLSMDDSPSKIYDWCIENHYKINILINNAGYGLSGQFQDHSLLLHLDVMKVNMNTPVELCYYFLPMLLDQQDAYILNIASQASFQAVPGLNIYAASKAFLQSFSRGLQYELRKTNVSVTVVYPGSTDTNFAETAKVGPKALRAAQTFNMSADKVAEASLNAMFSRKTEATIGMINKVGQFLVWLMPKKMSEKAAANIYEV